MSFQKAFSKSSNPMLGEEKYKTVLDAGLVERGQTMTVQGAINKTFILMGIMLAASTFSFMYPSMILVWTGIIGGAIVFYITSSNPSRAPYLAPVYAILEGLLVGAISKMYMMAFVPGIIFQAVTITFAILFMMLMIYKSGLIKVTEKLRAGITMAVGAVMIFYLINMVCHFIGINIPFIHEGGMLSIGITLVIIGIASMNLLLDFDNIEKGAAMKAPEYMEWYSGMGLLFTLVWLYLEILRLLSYIRD
ncbi:MAG: putative YccA/Bax inhibitor family protein [Saprospiraceae bacterium]|jgi:uncharacterized YccA/Bax inhibitor family protein